MWFGSTVVGIWPARAFQSTKNVSCTTSWPVALVLSVAT